MCQEIVEQPNPISLNTVQLQGIPQAPFAYVEQVVTGFRRLSLLLATHHRELCVSQGPLSAFEHCPLRFVYRGTAAYWNALHILKQPMWLREGTDRWIEMQSLKQPWLTRRADPNFLKLAEAEIHALEHLDVPWFGTTSTGYDLSTDSGEIIAHLFPVSALQQARARLTRLNAPDLERQMHLIRTTFLSARPTDVAPKEDLFPLWRECRHWLPITASGLPRASSQSLALALGVMKERRAMQRCAPSTMDGYPL